MQFGGQEKHAKGSRNFLMILRWFPLSFLPFLHADLRKKPMELYEIEWVQATSDLTILSALSIILFLVFLFAFSLSMDQEYPTSSSTLLDLSRSKCLSVREQVATRATWRDHSTKPNSRYPTREWWAWNSSSQLSCCYTWIRLLQLDDPRLDVVVLLTRRLWCGRVSGDVVVSARFSQFVDGKWTKKMSLCERNYHSAPTTPGADKTKQKRHTDHLELIRCRWWQGAVSANTRGGSK